MCAVLHPSASKPTNKDKIILNYGRVQRYWVAHSIFFSCYLSKMRVLYVALQFTLACTTEMFTIFLSFYKQLPKMQFCAQ